MIIFHVGWEGREGSLVKRKKEQERDWGYMGFPSFSDGPKIAVMTAQEFGWWVCWSCSGGS